MSEKEKEIRRMEKKKAKEQRSSKKKWNLKTTANGGKQELERAASGSRELVEGYQLSNGWAYLKSKIFDSLFPVFFSFIFSFRLAVKSRWNYGRLFQLTIAT